MTTKKTKRSKTPHPSLNPQVNSRIRKEYNDYDYLDKLSETELEFLNKFTDEYLNASPILDENKELSPEKNLHKDKKYKKELYDANNARNRCLFGRLKLNQRHLLTQVSDDLIDSLNDQSTNSVEDAYIEYLDYVEVKDMIEEYTDYIEGFSEEPE